MKQKITKPIYFLLILSIIISFYSVSAYAQGNSQLESKMFLGVSSIDVANKEDIESTDKIILGTYNSYPVSWIMLDKDTNLMLSQYVLDVSVFNNASSLYPNTILHNKMQSLYNTDLSLGDSEKNLIASTTLLANSMHGGAGDITDQKFYPLSGFGHHDSVQFYVDSGEFKDFVGEENDISNAYLIGTTTEHDWSLRSSDSGQLYYNIYAGGHFSNQYAANAQSGVRPAFTADFSSVLFTSASEGSKVSEIGEMESMMGTAPTSWKFTLLDSNRNFEIIDNPIVNEDTVTFDYQNAEVGQNDFISAIVTDENSNISHYIKIKSSDVASGSASFTVPYEFLGKDITFKFFNEQINGDNQTDYSSDLVEKTLTFESVSEGLYTVKEEIKNIASSADIENASTEKVTEYINQIETVIDKFERLSEDDKNEVFSSDILKIENTYRDLYSKSTGKLMLLNLQSNLKLEASVPVSENLDYVTLSVRDISDISSHISEIGDSLTGDLKLAFSFEVDLVSSGEEIPNLSPYTLIFKTSLSEGEKILVAHKKSDGIWEYIPAVVDENSNCTIITSSLSPFIGLQGVSVVTPTATPTATPTSVPTTTPTELPEVSPTPIPQPSSTPSTGDNSNIIPTMLIFTFVTILIVALLNLRKKIK